MSADWTDPLAHFWLQFTKLSLSNFFSLISLFFVSYPVLSYSRCISQFSYFFCTKKTRVFILYWSLAYKLGFYLLYNINVVKTALYLKETHNQQKNLMRRKKMKEKTKNSSNFFKLNITFTLVHIYAMAKFFNLYYYVTTPPKTHTHIQISLSPAVSPFRQFCLGRTQRLISYVISLSVMYHVCI